MANTPRNRHALRESSAPINDDVPQASDRWSKRVRVARTKLGWAVFAKRWFSVAEVVGEIEGTVIDDVDYGSRYCMDLGDSRCLEPDAPFRYMNHSCEPNCGLQWYDISHSAGSVGIGQTVDVQSASTPCDASGTRRRMFVLAYRRIGRGEELTIDYQWPAHMAIPCRCGAETCCRWIVAERDLATVVAAAAEARTAD